MASTGALVLLSLLCLPLRERWSVSSLKQQLPQQLQGTDAVVVLRPLAADEWSLFPSAKRLPQTLRIVQPGAAFIAVNFKRLDLLSGDRLVVRDATGATSITATSANASALLEELEESNTSPHSLLLRVHPFLIQGDSVVVEYKPSIPTLMMPRAPRQRDEPAVVLDSYAFVSYSRGFGASPAGGDPESTVGSTDEAKEAVCYRKTQPRMYAKARAVARLMIRSETSAAADQGTSWVFCTGWLLGRGNHLLTNHHCVKDAAAVEALPEPCQRKSSTAAPGFLSDVVGRFWPRALSPPDKTNRVVEAVVGFMAETKSCRDPGFMGERVGVVEATRVAVVAENPALDYALLRVLTNDSNADLARRYGYLRLRASGPVDGEAVYIPQHPRGEPKEIAATKDGKPAVIDVAPSDASGALRRASESSAVQPTVWYNADTEPGSSGSPVLSRRDNAVVALHRAGTAETAPSAATELFNMGMRTDLIARDLRRRHALPPKALVS
jgi:hypothetical protein